MLEKVKLPNKVYDVLKVISVLMLPFIDLVAAFGDIWGFAWTSPVIKTLAAVEVFVGAVLLVSTKNYNKEKEKTVLTGNTEPALEPDADVE